MSNVDVVVIGAGQAGLAVSRLLTARGVDHVVLERGRTAERWHARGWRSLRLLTPNWMTRLPGWSYTGSAPDGFMPTADVAGYLTDYAVSFAAPVIPGADVTSVRRHAGHLLVVSTRGAWTARGVVVATGACDLPAVPVMAERLHPALVQLTPGDYRDPGGVPPGGVLVVGASATGAQIADELAAAGRDVVLSVGRHTRVPRTYRGRDIMRWIDALGTLHRPLGPDRRRSEPSLQLVGNTERSIDLPSLSARGVRLAGRLHAVDGRRMMFADDLANSMSDAEARLSRLLTRIDNYAATTAIPAATDADDGPQLGRRIRHHAVRRLEIGGIRSVIWATGYRRTYPWLHVPVLDRDGEIRQINGRTADPGLFVIGLPNQTRRSSTFLDGVRFDADLVVDGLLESAGAARRAS